MPGTHHVIAGLTGNLVMPDTSPVMPDLIGHLSIVSAEPAAPHPSAQAAPPG